MTNHYFIGPDQIADLVGQVAKQLRRNIPLELELWSAAQVGEYLKCSDRYVLEHYCTLEDFPVKIRLPSRGGRGHPLWNAGEIIKWAQKYRR